MKQSLARILIILSLILSLTSFILSLIALNLPNWKYIHLRPTFLPMASSDNNQMDPLIRSEVNKYMNVLYHRDETHSFGLLNHCIGSGDCGRNRLPSFREIDYSLCHDVNYHRQCIFSSVSLPTTENNHDMKCTCQQPSYVKIIHRLLILLVCLQILFSFVNILRLCSRYCTTHCLNDIQLRLMSLISTLFSLLFLVIIIIQYRGNRFNEPLEFFESMRRHYSRVQIYTFSKDLESIIQQIESSLDIRVGGSYICVMIMLVLTSITFLTACIVEIKIPSTSPSLTFNEDLEEKKSSRYHNHTSVQATTNERFVPSEQIRFTRQTKV